MRDHGEGIFLRSRKILPFEILLIENCGGRDIFEKILNKQIRPCTSDTLIYQWIEATKGPAQTTSQEFLKQTNNTEDFKEKYAQELFCQQAAMPDQNIMTTIFANELEEILWKATPSILKNDDLRSHFPEPILDDIALYRFTVTLDLMKSPVASQVEIGESEVEERPNYEEEIEVSEGRVGEEERSISTFMGK